MLRAIFAQRLSRDGHVGAWLMEALRWWRHILGGEISETNAWLEDDSPPCHMFVDAASTPPRCAAVLVINRQVFYTDVKPPQSLMEKFCKRRDKQITTLEIVAIMIGLSTFASLLRGRRVILYSDNSGAEKSTVKGAARAPDHNSLVHAIWTHVLRQRIHLWIERVPSKDNISDCPSRFDYRLMNEIGAIWNEPVVDDLYLHEGL